MRSGKEISLLIVAIIVCVLGCRGVVWGDTFYVSPAGGGDGSVAAPKDLQSALSAAGANGETDDTLLLQTGTYTGNFIYDPDDGNGDIEIQGGWNNDFSVRILDPANTVLDGSNAGSVLKFNDFVTSTVSGGIRVEGLTVRNGNAAVGAGIYAYTQPPGTIDLRHNILENNVAEGFGSGCAVANGNWRDRTGGLITLSGNIIRGNRSTGSMDGAIRESGDGGGCGIIAAGPTLIANNLVYNNSAGTSNTYGGLGGGLVITLFKGTVYFVNNTVSDNQVFKELNSTDGTGGGVSFETEDTDPWGVGRVFVYNSIIYGNRSESPAGAGDIANNISNSGASAGSSLEIHYSDYGDLSIGGVPPLLSNTLNADPRFSRRPGTEYFLTALSPCVDAGVNSAPDMPSSDLDRQPRPQDGNGDGVAVANMGCYEEVVDEGVGMSWLLLLLGK